LNEFVNQNGGELNCVAGLTDTIYCFDLSNDALEEGLAIFTKFFTASLQCPSNELQVSHTHDNFAKGDKGWCNINMLQQLSHKESRFSSVGAVTGVLCKKDNLLHILQEYHKKYYSANQMNLVISGKASIPTLE